MSGSASTEAGEWGEWRPVQPAMVVALGAVDDGGHYIPLLHNESDAVNA